MYKAIGDMVYRYQTNGALQLVGIVLPTETLESFLAKNKKAFL